MASEREVAEWMATQIDNFYELTQSHAVSEIRFRFGAEFVYTNRNGNDAINASVLQEFDNLTREKVVWVLSKRRWRKREPFDAPGREQR